MKLPKERINCACLNDNVVTGSVIVVEIKDLPMDVVNRMYKNGTPLQNANVHYITNHGRVVDEIEARIIAIEAGQVETFRNAGKLCVTDLWKRD